MNQLNAAAHCNLAHHRFLILLGINMSQMIMSFAFDFHLLYCANSSCFIGVGKDVGQMEALFDFFYLSTLNFSFFGYSDIAANGPSQNRQSDRNCLSLRDGNLSFVRLHQLKGFDSEPRLMLGQVIARVGVAPAEPWRCQLGRSLALPFGSF